jgi:hypothetical protein
LRRNKDKEVSLKRNLFEWKDISKNDDQQYNWTAGKPHKYLEAGDDRIKS